MAKKMIVLKSSDNDIFEIEEIVAQQSVMINNMIQDSCADSVIPLPNVTSKTLAKVIEYCKRHAHPPAPNPEKKPWTTAWALSAEESELMNFDREFVGNVDQKLLFDMILAANYLEIESLLDLTCQKVADMISRKTPEQIRETFNIVNDLTPEEEDEIRRENAWAFAPENSPS